MDAKVKDFYSSEVFFLIDWFFSEYVVAGFNGPQMAQIRDYPNFSKWQSEAFKYLFNLVRLNANLNS